MEAISRLQRFWSALLGATGKFSRSVATDELDAWMLFEPHFQCGSLTIWKQVHPRADSLRTVLQAEIGAQLTPAQQSRYRDLVARFEHQRRGADTGSKEHR